MKIVFGCLNHEANSFASDPGTWERWFRTNFVAVGDELLQYRDKKGAHLAGMFAAAEEEGVELIPYQKLRRPIYPLDPGMEFEA